MPEVLAAVRPLTQPGTPLGDLAARLAGAGHACFLVGGSVRDVLLGLDHVDLDVTTDARPDSVRAVVDGWADSVWLQGQRFGTVGIVRAGIAIEITTFRADVYRSESRKPQVEYSDTIEEDLVRRDFTVNAIAAALPGLELVDPFGGRTDLEARVLRTPQAAARSFTDDPLRMLRAARFASTYGFVPVRDVVDAMREHRARLEIVSAERIHDELRKLVLAPAPEVGFELLATTGVLAEFLPEPVRYEDLVRVEPHEVRRLAVLLGGLSPEAARARLRALRFSTAVVREVADTIAVLDRIDGPGVEWDDASVREVVRRGGDGLRDAVAVAAGLGRAATFRTAYERLRVREDLDAPDSPLDGAAVMAHLGLPPGPRVGEALDALRRARIARGPLDAEAARRVLDEWAAEHL